MFEQMETGLLPDLSPDGKLIAASVGRQTWDLIQLRWHYGNSLETDKWAESMGVKWTPESSLSPIRYMAKIPSMFGSDAETASLSQCLGAIL
jgi:hypothetical protein